MPSLGWSRKAGGLGPHDDPHAFREVGVGIELGSPLAPNRGVTYTTDFGRRPGS